MNIILNGIFTGLLLSIFVGATFFMLIETSMTRGFKAALWFDLGVVVCDATIIAVVYFFESWINRTVVHNEYFSIAGGIVFMGFGVNYMFLRQPNDPALIAKKHNLKLFMNGFIINLMNPSVVFFWLGTMAVTLSKFNYSGRNTFMYYTATLITMAGLDITKAYFASRIRKFITTRVLKIVYILSGILMFGLGLYFILK